MQNVRIVSQYQGNRLIAKYSSIKAAANIVGAQPSHIGKVASGKRASAAGYGWKYAQKLSNRLTTARKGITQLDDLGNIVAIYESVEVASELTGIKLTNINKVLSGTSTSAGGYNWVA